jgi:hypothetical protein
VDAALDVLTPGTLVIAVNTLRWEIPVALVAAERLGDSGPDR